MKFPETKMVNIVDEIHGIKVSDPYRWLEDYDNSDVQEWTKNQNEYTNSSLRGSGFDSFSEELVKNFKVVNFSNLIPARGKYFYSERQPDEDQFAVYVKNGINGDPTKLIDPNGSVFGNTINVAFWVVSRTGKYLTYGLSKGGDEMATLYVKDVDLNKDLSDTITHCRGSVIRWLPDDSGFFYTRNPRPGTVPKNEEHMHPKVYFHKLGDNPNNDELIFGQDRPKDDMIGLAISVDGRYLAISVSQTWTKNDLYIYDSVEKKIIPLVTGISSKFMVRFLSNQVLIDTNYKANNFRILSVPLENLFTPIDQWNELISEREYLLESISTTKSKIIIQYLINACSKVFIFDYSGKEIGTLPLPEYSSIAGISSNRDEEEFFFGVTSFTFPMISYRYDSENDSYSIYRRTDNPINLDDYEVKQEWYLSKDGTKIPMFIFHKKDIDLDGQNPTILYGYGGFSSNQTPGFMRNQIPWIRRGGVFAIANIRGGGEFGEKWHKDGVKEKKQNSFDDFIAAGEYLISQKYTNKAQLGILGGSNGGLLVSAVSVQRPDLFKAVCSRVPLTDMVRFPKFGMAIRWVHEYGNPEVKSDLENILKWSPYHNIKDGIEYPNFLFTTGDKDTRVDPLHARKMTAILQSTNKVNPVFIFTEMDAGHGPGKPVKKMVESQAMITAFFADKLGL